MTDTMGTPETMNTPEIVAPVADAIREPSNPNHFMVARPVTRRLRVFQGDQLLAETTNALCLVEIGRKAYDPVFYVPPEDLLVALDKTEKTTRCALKGDASYFALDGEEIGWAYLTPFDFAAVLTGLHAFWADRVRFELGA